MKEEEERIRKIKLAVENERQRINQENNRKRVQEEQKLEE